MRATTDDAAGPLCDDRSMNKILIATDGSVAGAAALDFGLQLAAALGTATVLLHSDAALAEELFEADPENGPSQERIEQRDPVLGAAAKRARELGVQAQLELIGDQGTDAIADAICGAATGLGADLVVLGSRGHGAVASAVLGSVSQGVLRYAEQPVVVVKG